MISTKPWTLPAVARLFAGVLMTMCMGMVAAGILAGANSGLKPASLEFVQMMIMIVTFQGAALVQIAFFLRAVHSTWGAAFGWESNEHSSGGGAVATGLAVAVAVLPLMWLLQTGCADLVDRLHLNAVPQEVVQELQSGDLAGWQIAAFGVFTIVIAPVAEELLFRGILYPVIKQRGFPRCALWGTSILFGVAHMNLVSLVPLILFAVVLARLYEFTGNLLAPIATHSLFNAVNFFYLVFADPVDTWLKLHLHLS